MNPETLAIEQAAMQERHAPAQPEVRLPGTPILDKIIAAQASVEQIGKRSKDVYVYVRHSENCDRTDRFDNSKCGCPLSLYDKLLRKPISARTINWENAQNQAQAIMDSRNPVKRELAELKRTKEYEAKTIEFTIKKYLEDCEDLGAETIEAYECALTQMKDYMHSKAVTMIGDITPQLLKDCVKALPDKQKSSKNKKRRQIKTFFKWVCEEVKYVDLTKNPALALPTIKGEERVPAVPFYEDQLDAIIDATYVYEDSKRFRDAAIRLRALILLMRWSGLAIRDALTLPRWRIVDGVLKVRRTKTKVWVTLVLHEDALNALAEVKNDNPEYFFYNGTAKKRSLVGDYNRMLRRLWTLVKWPRPVEDGDHNPIKPHSHMFRHSFAYWWLNTVNEETGRLGDIRDLQLLLGHKKLATTEGHYSGYMPEQNERMNNEMRARHASHKAKKSGKKGVAKVVPIKQRAHSR